MSPEEIRAYLLKRSDEMLSGKYQSSEGQTDQGKQILMAEKAFWQFADQQTLAKFMDYLKLAYPK